MDDIILDGTHVRLEPMRADHVDELFEVGREPGLWRWTQNSIATLDDMHRYVEAALRERAEGRSHPFVQIARASGRIAGSTRYGNIEPAHRRLEIGWTWLGSSWQRSAINTEAKYLLLRHAFEERGDQRVELKTDVLNTKSRAAIERIGAVREGIFRRHMIADSGRVRDTVYYSIVAEEWVGVKERLERKLKA